MRRHVDTGVAQQAVDLLYRVLRRKAHRGGEPTTDGVNSQGGRVEHADNAACEGQHTSCVDVLAEQIGDGRLWRTQLVPMAMTPGRMEPGAITR